MNLTSTSSYLSTPPASLINFFNSGYLFNCHPEHVSMTACISNASADSIFEYVFVNKANKIR